MTSTQENGFNGLPSESNDKMLKAQAKENQKFNKTIDKEEKQEANQVASALKEHEKGLKDQQHAIKDEAKTAKNLAKAQKKHRHYEEKVVRNQSKLEKSKAELDKLTKELELKKKHNTDLQASVAQRKAHALEVKQAKDQHDKERLQRRAHGGPVTEGLASTHGQSTGTGSPTGETGSDGRALSNDLPGKGPSASSPEAQTKDSAKLDKKIDQLAKKEGKIEKAEHDTQNVENKLLGDMHRSS